MRRAPVAALLLVLLTPPPVSAPARAQPPASRWIVALAPAIRADLLAAMDRAEPLAGRFAAGGLHVVAQLGNAPADAGRPARPSPLPWALDPSRVVLVEAADPAATTAAPALFERDPGIAWWEPDRIREPCAWTLGAARRARMSVLAERAPWPVGANPGGGFPDDPLFRDGRQWGLGAADGAPGAGDLRALAAWRTTTGSESLRLAVCDTGVDPAHPDLAGTLADGSPRLVEGVDVTAPDGAYADSAAHGTMVAGIMAARTHDGPHFDSLGIAGVCGGDGTTTAGCGLIPVKITRGSGSAASSFAIAQGILHAACAGARAINLSFAATGPSRTERLALLDALVRGAVVVCAAGNNGLRDGSASMWPAAHAADGLCVQVGACDPTGAPGVFSSHGPGLDVLAPGLDVWTTYLTYPSAFGASFPGYLAGSGTSFAAPFATGTVGLLAAARPELAPGDFQHVLRLSARDVDAPGPDGATGFGLLDAAAALAFVGPGNALWHGDAAPALAAVALDTLVVAERGLALLDSLERRALAERWTLRARIALPDSLADSARAWVRVSGTTTTRGDWRVPYVTPWAEVRSVGPRTIELEGALFRIVDARAERLAATSDPARWIPAPPERARITFTMIGTRRQTPAVAPADTAATARSWSGPIRVSPNPVRGAATLSGPPGATVRVVDTAGREIARLTLDATGGRARWDGLGPGGRAIAPGLYWAIGPGGRATRFVRLR